MRHSFKQLWPLFCLYALEVGLYLPACLTALSLLDPAVFAVLSKRAGIDHVILASPVVVGFLFRLYFVKGLWIAYAWVGFLLSHSAVELYDGRWVGFTSALLHPVIVTAVLVLSASGREFFAYKQPDIDGGVPADFPEHEKLSAESFLIMRIKKRQPKPAAIYEYERGLMQGYWVGAAMMIWGFLLSARLVGLIGACFMIACFLFHRSIAGKKRLFFGKKSSSR